MKHWGRLDLVKNFILQSIKLFLYVIDWLNLNLSSFDQLPKYQILLFFVSSLILLILIIFIFLLSLASFNSLSFLSIYFKLLLSQHQTISFFLGIRLLIIYSFSELQGFRETWQQQICVFLFHLILFRIGPILYWVFLWCFLPY